MPPEDHIEHYGVQGMRWGVRKSRPGRRADRRIRQVDYKFAKKDLKEDRKELKELGLTSLGSPQWRDAMLASKQRADTDRLYNRAIMRQSAARMAAAPAAIAGAVYVGKVISRRRVKIGPF